MVWSFLSFCSGTNEKEVKRKKENVFNFVAWRRRRRRGVFSCLGFLSVKHPGWWEFLLNSKRSQLATGNKREVSCN